MNLTEFTYLLNHPSQINQKNTADLETIINKFPYFQSARALHLKGLYQQDSFQYNQNLRLTASYTTDRNILFDFITSGNFEILQQTFLEEKAAKINDITVNEFNIVIQPTVEKDKLEQSIKNSILKSDTVKERDFNQISKKESPEERLEIGKPLSFSKEEKHSFQEWLKLASITPIVREKKTEEKTEKQTEISKKIEIINKFIEANPKISPVKNISTTNFTPIQTEETGLLMTETLAKVYLEQKKYQKAIQAYEILILKYPEKSSLFADRILDIKILQQNNN